MDDCFEKLNFRPEIVRLLKMRGIDTAPRLERFLSPGRHFSDPFALPNMAEAVARIRRALDEGEKIAVFGDYDADGICSVSILYLALTAHGGEVCWYVPEREEGYGISEAAVEWMAENEQPALILTCDCGVSAVREVELIQDLGMDAVVTDHHELPPQLPDCPVVNPKLGEDPDTRNLCGAGVCYKLVEALFGREEAAKFLDLAAVATVADSVELIGENRDIVAAGLKRINEDPRPGLAALMEAAGVSRKATAGMLAFTVVPRINAAGRVGEAKRAVGLFSENDPRKIASLVEELNAANAERQQLCEGMMRELEGSPDFRTRLHDRVLVFYSPAWQSGIIGIVASKLADCYRRPAFIFCDSEEGLIKGSGRSVEGVNLFELLSGLSDLLVRFGGHSQAAGATLRREDLPEFIRRANLALPDYAAGEELCYDLEIPTSAVDMRLARELAALEPFGVGNRRPQFLVRAEKMSCHPMKRHREHLVLKLPEFEVTAFHAADRAEAFSSPYPKRLLLDLSVNEFGGREYLKCLLKDADLSFEDHPEFGEVLLFRYLCQLQSCGPLPECSAYESLSGLDLGGDGLGTVLIVSRPGTLKKLLALSPFGGWKVSLFAPNDLNNVDRILFSPSAEVDLSRYDRLVFVDRPLHSGFVSALAGEGGGQVFVPVQRPRLDLSGLTLRRETFLEVYRKISAQAGRLNDCGSPTGLYEQFKKFDGSLSFLQFSVCYAVFRELGLFLPGPSGGLQIRHQRAELRDSPFYERLTALKTGQRKARER